MIIPISDLTDSALCKIVEEFVLREGTDYGSGEYSLSSKVEQVVRQLRKGDAALVFDDRTESIDIVSAKRALELSLG